MAFCIINSLKVFRVARVSIKYQKNFLLGSRLNVFNKVLHRYIKYVFVYITAIRIECKYPGGAPSRSSSLARFRLKMISRGTKYPDALAQHTAVVVVPRSPLVMVPTCCLPFRANFSSAFVGLLKDQFRQH